MKKIREKIWWIVAAYLVVGYIFVGLYRLRFLLFVFVIILILTLLDLEKNTRLYGIIGLSVPVLFFFKIIPSPYSYFVAHNIVMSISIILTVMTIFLTTSLAILVCFLLEQKRQHFSELRKK